MTHAAAPSGPRTPEEAEVSRASKLSWTRKAGAEDLWVHVVAGDTWSCSLCPSDGPCPIGHGVYHFQNTGLRVCVCVYYCRTYYKAVRGGGRRRVDDMCYEMSGSIDRGLLQGPGRLTWEDGSRYEGEFSSSTLHGNGEYVWPSGDVFSEAGHATGLQKIQGVAASRTREIFALTKSTGQTTLNDVSATLETFVNNAQILARGDRSCYTTPQLSLTLSFGSGRVQEAIKNAGVVTCISEDIRQQVQSSATQVRRPGTSGKPALPGAVAALFSGFLDDAADTVTRAFVGFAYHVIDVFLAWLLGVVRGVQEQFALVHRHMAQIRNIGEFALSEIVIMVDRNLVRDKSTKSCPMSLARCVDCSMWMID